MPSLHVGWALLIAVALIASSRNRWRWLWLLHPMITLLVVVATANHFWLDGIAGGLLVLVAYKLFKPDGSLFRTRPQEQLPTLTAVSIPA
jgi:hypothetical protein